MDNRNIDLLVHKKVTNQITKEEGLLLDHLIASDKAVKADADNVQSAWDAALTIDNEVQFDSKKAFNQFLEKTRSQDQVVPIQKAKIFSIKRVMYAAAMLTIAFFAVNLLTKTNNTTISSDNTSFTAVLPEGSEIKLAPHSSIQFDKSAFGKERRVVLNGNGIIHVTKTGAPFIVQGKDFEVQVMGTTFYVASNGSNDNVRVLEGKVEVRNHSSKIQITDKQGVSIKGSQLTKTDNVDFSDLGWQNDNMEYNNTPLSKVLADIESKFSITIAVKSTEAIRLCTFTSGSLAKLPLAQIIAIMESTYSTKFIKKSDKEYTLGSISCK
jgi:transmembrane sensor